MALSGQGNDVPEAGTRCDGQRHAGLHREVTPASHPTAKVSGLLQKGRFQETFKVSPGQESAGVLKLQLVHDRDQVLPVRVNRELR